MNDNEQMVSAPLNADQARAKCEEAADMIVSKHVPGGHWFWVDDQRQHLTVFKADGTKFMTLKIEALQ